ncbi:MAG: nuclear transport factor 2 family protein [Deltaproteobacteria bacterium]|nr:nuclear transport factor 2 family protein [Deltaproteobacteria bacterium]
MRHTTFVLVIATALGCGTAEPPEQTSAETPVEAPAETLADRWGAYLEAHNAGRTEEMLAFYTEDAVFAIPTVGELRGTEQLRDLVAWDVANHGQLNSEGYAVSGDQLTIEQVTESNDWFRAIGVETIHYQPGTRIVFREGRLAEVRPTPFTEESTKAVEAAFGPFMAWASAHPDKPLEALLPGGKFDYSKQSAERWKTWFGTWHAAREAAPEPE